jgi:hypothetical protein
LSRHPYLEVQERCSLVQTTVGNAWEIPPTSPRRAAEVATAELDAELVLLGTLDEQDWRRPVGVGGWAKIVF